MLRPTARIVSRAVSEPPEATTVWRPGRSATKAPSGSTKAAAPGATRVSGVRVETAYWIGKSGTALPPASRARASNQTTSPVRTSSSAAETSRRTAGLALTRSAASPLADSALAEIVADPSACSMRTPWGLTVATAESLDDHAKSGLRSAPEVSVAVAVTRSEVPA